MIKRASNGLMGANNVDKEKRERGSRHFASKPRIRVREVCEVCEVCEDCAMTRELINPDGRGSSHWPKSGDRLPPSTPGPLPTIVESCRGASAAGDESKVATPAIRGRTQNAPRSRRPCPRSFLSSHRH
jgi:hypothetical protein